MHLRLSCEADKFFFLGWSGTKSTIIEATTSLLDRPLMMDDDECAAVGGMSGRGNQSSRIKPATVPLCLPQIPHDLTRLEVGPPRWEAASNRLSYYTALEMLLNRVNVSLCCSPGHVWTVLKLMQGEPPLYST
jgi:hypothetical protein